MKAWSKVLQKVESNLTYFNRFSGHRIRLLAVSSDRRLSAEGRRHQEERVSHLVSRARRLQRPVLPAGRFRSRRSLGRISDPHRLHRPIHRHQDGHVTEGSVHSRRSSGTRWRRRTDRIEGWFYSRSASREFSSGIFKSCFNRAPSDISTTLDPCIISLIRLKPHSLAYFYGKIGSVVPPRGTWIKETLLIG